LAEYFGSSARSRKHHAAERCQQHRAQTTKAHCLTLRCPIFFGNGIHAFLNRGAVDILPRQTIGGRYGSDMPQHAADDGERQQ
jgi:hypothetical protein